MIAQLKLYLCNPKTALRKRHNCFWKETAEGGRRVPFILTVNVPLMHLNFRSPQPWRLPPISALVSQKYCGVGTVDKYKLVTENLTWKENRGSIPFTSISNRNKYLVTIKQQNTSVALSKKQRIFYYDQKIFKRKCECTA